MHKLMVKGKKTERQKAKKKFEELSLTDKVQTNKEYGRICPSFPIKGMVVGKEIVPGLEGDADTIPYLVTVETEPGRTIKVNALWLEKIR